MSTPSSSSPTDKAKFSFTKVLPGEPRSLLGFLTEVGVQVVSLGSPSLVLTRMFHSHTDPSPWFWSSVCIESAGMACFPPLLWRSIVNI